jgi:hypothetical protein
MQPTPLCPITGVPASRRIQSISAWLLIGLWRWSFGVATDRQLGNIGHFGLWESPCGLAFFEPMLAGDTKLRNPKAIIAYSEEGNTGKSSHAWVGLISRESSATERSHRSGTESSHDLYGAFPVK